MTENAFADILHAYVAQYGAKPAIATIVAVLDDDALNHGGKPRGVIASINAALLRQAESKLI